MVKDSLSFSFQLGKGESITYKLTLHFFLDITRPYMASLGPNTSRWLEPNGPEQASPFASLRLLIPWRQRWRQQEVLLFSFPYILLLIKDTWRGGIALTLGLFFPFSRERSWRLWKNAWGGMEDPAHLCSACQVDRQGNMASWQARQKAIARKWQSWMPKKKKMTGTFQR